MTPKERKDLIFRKSRPLARRFEVMDGGNYSKDTGILWAAYQAGSFEMPTDLTQEEFMGEIEATMQKFQDLWIIDDDTKKYSTGRGPVGLVGSNSIGLIVEPKFMFFKWASCRNVLKSTVAFLNMIKGSLRTGIILIRVNNKRSVAEHLKKYDLLFFLGKSNDNEYLYSVRGRGSVNA
jgi:hypothetical protein